MSDREIRKELTRNHTSRLMHDNPGLSRRKAILRAKRRTRLDLSEGPVRAYLDSQRESVMAAKGVELRRCTCPAARVKLQDQKITSTAPRAESRDSSASASEGRAATESGFSLSPANIESGEESASMEEEANINVFESSDETDESE